MMRNSFKYATYAMLVTGCLSSGTALAETKVTGEVSAGLQQYKVDGAPGKLQEYRDLEEGLLLNSFRVKVDGLDSLYFLDLRGKDLLQDDESYGLTGGVHGKYKFGLTYDKTPHNFSSGRLILNDLGGGRFGVPDAVQLQLQNAEILRSQRFTYDPVTGAPLGTTSTAGGAFINPADAQNMVQDATMVGIVNNLYGTANTVKYGLKREKTGADFSFAPFQDVKVWTKLSNEKRIGTRRINQGTYERFNNGNTPNPLSTTDLASNRAHIVDYFLVAGVELPETIDYRTTTFNVGTGVYKKNWMADVEYTLTNFENKVDSLVWDNPFRLDSAQATTAGNGAGNPFNRGRSALGQITLSPDSRSHDITLSGSVELPLHSRFTGTIGYGWVTQDDAFDPYTLNGAIVANNVPGTPSAATLALPQNSLNGKVATLFQNYQLSGKPTEALAVTAKYRYYDYDNKSDHITFPGYAAFGDSYWRTERNDVSSGQDALVANETLSYTRQNAEISADYHLLKPLTVSVEGFWEGWDRKETRIEGTDELGAGAGFIYKPAKFAKLKGNYRYSHRTVDGYEPGNTKENPEAIGLANYDWADRVRHKADLRLQLAPVESVTVGFNGQYHNDKFGGDNRFGLKKNDIVTAGVDVNYNVSDALSLYANYAKDYRKGAMQSGAKDDVYVAGTNNFNPDNYWNSDIFEKVDTVGLGFNYQVIPEKLTLNTSYNVSYSKMDINTYNPNGAAKLVNAAAQDFGTITNKYQEVKTDLAYNFTKNLKGGVTYVYELFMQDDFANTGEYLAGSTFENSTKYLYTGANNLSYDAHIFGAYVNYKF